MTSHSCTVMFRIAQEACHNRPSARAAGLHTSRPLKTYRPGILFLLTVEPFFVYQIQEAENRKMTLRPTA